MAATSAASGATAGRDRASTAEEARLAHAAAAGDGAAFATLYDRYEGRIFNFCHRLLGSRDDAADATQDAFLKVLQRLPKLEGRELNFSAYLFTAARNASYDMIGKRKRVEPTDDVPEPGGGREPGDLYVDPERAAMVTSLQDDVREANERLPERQREVLALRELEELSYDEIAGIMDMNRNSVAQLISRARINLRDELRGTALASVAASSPDCERALPLIAMRQDRQLEDPDDRAWLAEHLGACETCRVAAEAVQEAGVASWSVGCSRCSCSSASRPRWRSAPTARLSGCSTPPAGRASPRRRRHSARREAARPPVRRRSTRARRGPPAASCRSPPRRRR